MRINRWICATASAGAVGWSLVGAAAQAQQVELVQQAEAEIVVEEPKQKDVLLYVVDAQAAPPAPGNAEPTEDVIINLAEPVGDGELRVQALDLTTGEGAGASKFWIGVMCQPVDEPLRAQLNLTDGEGVVVGEVVPDSPAAKSGLKKYDVILQAGDAKVVDAGALMRVVEATGPKELNVRVIRAGQPNVITVVPAERAALAAPVQPAPAATHDRVYRLLQRFHNQDGGPVVRLFHPGMVAPPPQAVPENLDVRIEKHGNKPAKIHVEQDGKTWDVNENELDGLPEELRGHIGRMIGHGSAPLGIRLEEGGPRQEEFHIEVVPPPGAPQVAPLPPGAPGTAALPGVPGAPAVRERLRSFTQRVEGAGNGERLEQRIDQLNERLDRLQELLDRLQKQEPKTETAPPTP